MFLAIKLSLTVHDREFVTEKSRPGLDKFSFLFKSAGQVKCPFQTNSQDLKIAGGNFQIPIPLVTIEKKHYSIEHNFL